MGTQVLLAMFVGGFVLGYFLKGCLVDARMKYLCTNCENNKEG